MTGTSVSVLGTGAIGSAVARALLSAGHEVHVWNRSLERASPLVGEGAERAASAAEALDRSPLALLCLTDHAAARDVLTRLTGQSRGETVVLLCTGTPQEVDLSATLAGSRGLSFLAAGIQASPTDVGTPRALLLYAGDARVFARHRSVLEVLGRARWVGGDAGAAAVLDLALFGLWYDAQVGLLRALELTGAAGVPAAEVGALAGPLLQHVVDGVAATVQEVETGEYPAGPASLAEHARLLADLRETRRSARLGDGGLGAVERLVAALAGGPSADRGLTAVLDVRA